MAQKERSSVASFEMEKTVFQKLIAEIEKGTRPYLMKKAFGEDSERDRQLIKGDALL